MLLKRFPAARVDVEDDGATAEPAARVLAAGDRPGDSDWLAIGSSSGFLPADEHRGRERQQPALEQDC